MAIIHCHGFRGNDETTAYIGRPTIFGNPYILEREEDREIVLEKYKTYFTKRIEKDPEFREAVLSLKGKDLACWCAPRACHGDVILEWLNQKD